MPTNRPYTTATTAASVGVNQPARMPPRMSTGAARPQEASRSERQNGGRASAPSFAPKPCRRDSQIAGMISVMPVSRPGMRPAANSAGTEAPGTSTEYTMNAMDGGMRMSMAAAAPMTLAEKGAG